MKTKLLLVVGLLWCVGGVVMAEEGRDRFVRLAEHFGKFRASTDAMVKSRRLIDATPISLATKPGVTP